MQIQKESTIGDIVAANFNTANIFDFYGIDFCCGGKKTLAEACEEKNLNIDEIIEKLNALGGNGTTKGVNYNDWELDFLVDYIINNHHSYVIRSMPSIHQHAWKVAEVHGINHPELKQVAELFTEVKEEFEGHMMKEERMLFPYIKNLAEAKRNNQPVDFPPFGTVGNPIRVMEMEHDRAGEILFRIKELSKNYTLPEDACTTYTVLFKELKEFEDDLHTHIHLENNILFPKAITLEKSLSEIFSNNS